MAKWMDLDEGEAGSWGSGTLNASLRTFAGRITHACAHDAEFLTHVRVSNSHRSR